MRPRTTTRPTDQPGARQIAATPSRGAAWTVAAVLAVLVGVVYVPAVNVPFIFDDIIGIVQNDSIVSLWPLVDGAKPGPLNPPPELPTSARPLVNLSFAINYHFGELSPTGYHLFNLALHFFNAMLLWSITCRTLRLPYFGDRFARSAEWLALAVAGLWSLHPLQTEAVIYATQRTELMMAFFYFATLYCSLRYWLCLPLSPGEGGVENSLKDPTKRYRRTFWLILATLCCFCGMGSKEVMVSAPLIILLFERTFIAGSLKTSLRRSWPLYIGLASSWLLLAALMVNAPHRDSAGFDVGVSAYEWWLTQSKVLFLYLKLVVWPWPLLIHYQLPYFAKFGDAWIYVVPLVLIGVATLVLLWQNRPLGFLGTWFFAILSPTFVIPVVIEMAAERRMYLALVTPVVILVVGCYQLAEAILKRRQAKANTSISSRAPVIAVGVPALVLALVFCLVSTVRLAAYDNEVNLWLQVLQSQPENSLAHQSVAAFLEKEGHDESAAEQYREAVRFNPNAAQAHYRLALLLNKSGAHDEAAAEFDEAARILPEKNANMHNDMAVALYMAGRNDQAIEAFRNTLAIDPNFWPGYRNLGTALQKAGKFQEAVQSFESAVRLNPQAIEIYNDLANAHFRLNQRPQAIAALERGLELAQAAGDTENSKKFAAALQNKR
jgi:tetratricopeptide (TPR) repeat protein